MSSVQTINYAFGWTELEEKPLSEVNGGAITSAGLCVAGAICSFGGQIAGNLGSQSVANALNGAAGACFTSALYLALITP